MAEQGRTLSQDDQNRIRRLAQHNSIRQTAKMADVSRNTARKYLRLISAREVPSQGEQRFSMPVRSPYPSRAGTG
jgi:hypothetical protein